MHEQYSQSAHACLLLSLHSTLPRAQCCCTEGMGQSLGTKHDTSKHYSALIQCCFSCSSPTTPRALAVLRTAGIHPRAHWNNVKLFHTQAAATAINCLWSYSNRLNQGHHLPLHITEYPELEGDPQGSLSPTHHKLRLDTAFSSDSPSLLCLCLNGKQSGQTWAYF